MPHTKLVAEPYRVKFVSGEPDLVTTPLHATDHCAEVVRQVREHKNLVGHAHKVIRIICSGKELYPDDPVGRASSKVLHCMISEGAPPPERLAQPRKTVDPPPPPMEPPPLDWLDVIDPGVVLMWIFGSILVILWLLFLVYSSLFDRTSFIILCMMTVAFLIPCVLSYIPVPAFLQPQGLMIPQPMGGAPGAGGAYYDPVTGRTTALPPSGAQSRYPGGIPPRPRAPGQ